MRRDLERTLLAWKTSPHRKPLLLKGARQVGKTHLLRRLGRDAFARCAYFNFEEDPSLDSLFQQRLSPKTLIPNLSRYAGFPIDHETLIVLDEVQASNRALNSLKYFCEQAPDYHVAAAGSLLGVQLSKPRSFPVGKVDFADLYPLTFFEFLDAVGRSDLRELVTSTQIIEPYPEPFHQQLCEQLGRYYLVGGLPEAVHTHVETDDLESVRRVHRSILAGYEADFGKHAPASDVPKLHMIWQSIPAQLARENKKFMFSAVRPSARAREYENAIQWLDSAGLILRTYRLSAGAVPLAAHADASAFKVYCLDTGLLATMAGLPQRLMVQGSELLAAYKGALVENYVAQQLAAGGIGLHYWASEGRAEVDFVWEQDGAALPLEAKAGVNPRSKSLRLYGERYHPPILTRTTLLNLKRDGHICNIPLYAINALDGITSLAAKHPGPATSDRSCARPQA